MSKFIQRVGFNSNRIFNNSLTQLSKRSLTDRSHRLAGLAALAGAQAYRNQISDAYWHPYMMTHQGNPVFSGKERDMSKQLVIDLRDNNEYKSGHIANAVNLNKNQLDCTKYIDTAGGITFDEIYNAMRDVGASTDTSEIILYDNDGQSACRLWFILRYFGFTNVRILNGGYNRWVSAGIPIDTQDNIPKRSSNLELKPSRPQILTRPTQMIENHQSKRSKYIDSRTPDAFKQKHIDRAINIPADEFMKDAQFKTVQEIRDMCYSKGFDVHDSSNHVICYSSKSISSSIAYFCMDMVGFNRLALYDQGFENWELNKDKSLNVDQQEAFSR